MAKQKIIIVGGGLSGLSAAMALSEHEQFEIHLVEKRNHLGGRVQSCNINGQMIDVGGFLVYPWYHRYRELVEEVGLSEELVKVPNVLDYFAAYENSHDRYQEGFRFSFKDIIEIFLRIFPKPIIDNDPTEPVLDAYDNLNIQDYVKSLNLEPEKTTYYLRVFDTYLQGYCYGGVSEHKMAFMAATLFQNIIHGDVHSASYLRNGSNVFIDALQKKLEERGVQIHVNCILEEFKNNQLITSHGVMEADDFIFCHTPAEVRYSKFITATISYSGIALVDEDDSWGSCFYKEDASQPYQVLSVVNIDKLYTEKVARHLNLNIKVNAAHLADISSNELLELIKCEMQVHFKGINVLGIVNREDWEKAMPVAAEEYVEMTRNRQGQSNCYYAGDYMGCPSMETALVNGKRAADELIKKLV